MKNKLPVWAFVFLLACSSQNDTYESRMLGKWQTDFEDSNVGCHNLLIYDFKKTSYQFEKKVTCGGSENIQKEEGKWSYDPSRSELTVTKEGKANIIPLRVKGKNKLIIDVDGITREFKSK